MWYPAPAFISKQSHHKTLNDVYLHLNPIEHRAPRQTCAIQKDVRHYFLLLKSLPFIQGTNWSTSTNSDPVMRTETHSRRTELWPKNKSDAESSHLNLSCVGCNLVLQHRPWERSRISPASHDDWAGELEIIQLQDTTSLKIKQQPLNKLSFRAPPGQCWIPVETLPELRGKGSHQEIIAVSICLTQTSPVQ